MKKKTTKIFAETSFSIRENAVRLMNILNPLLSSEVGYVIQFIGANPREGVSSISRELAIVASRYTDGPLLLLDLDWGFGNHYQAFQKGTAGFPGVPGEAVDLGIDPNKILRSCTSHVSKNKKDPFITVHRVGESNLYVSQQNCTHQNCSTSGSPHVINGNPFWHHLREKIQLTIIDSPPASQHLDGIVVCSQVDAVIIVVSAEKTRIPVISSLRDKLLDQQAPLAGIVFNKRRWYIPSYLYRWMSL
ncbi:conserved hypothetical protein [Gammaproteobacteria bacterium]